MRSRLTVCGLRWTSGYLSVDKIRRIMLEKNCVQVYYVVSV